MKRQDHVTRNNIVGLVFVSGSATYKVNSMRARTVSKGSQSTGVTSVEEVELLGINGGYPIWYNLNNALGYLQAGQWAIVEPPAPVINNSYQII